jgi:serine/threonine protein kinase/WD40 repeat protein
MTTWNPRANELFLQALERRGLGERQAYLDSACAGDAALRAEVEALLDASARAGTFLEAPAAGFPSPLGGEGLMARGVGAAGEPIRERPGTVIGPYKLLEQIGEGTFGVVFMAEQQQPVRRKVALKVLKPGMDTRQVVARFEAERQALALMDHPNIAHIFDGGETASGRPYFVMELVRGVPVTDFCDQNQLGVRERLELFIAVCQAVQHAHQKGVIHRDLKPSNVLVTLHDDKAVAKVIDFGIAKATGQQLTDKTLFTNFAQMVGTPLYMSPEQAQMNGLDVDTRSDIYSLGVLLYELLTGTTPFDKERLRTAGYDEIRRVIREEEPAKPSTRVSASAQAAATASANRRSDSRRLSQLYRGELDWVVMKALEKDRNRRYESASAFALDVRRYLADEPVQACPPSAWYRFAKLARRNKGAFFTASALAVAVLLAVVVLAVSNVRITDERDQKRAALHDKEIALESARRSEVDAKGQLVRALLNQARALRTSGQMGQRFTSLESLQKAAEGARSLGVLDEHALTLRAEAAACLALTDLRVAGGEWEAPARWGQRWAPPVAFDARLERYACADRQGNVSVMETAGGRLVASLPRPAEKARDVNLCFSPDGRFLATVYWFEGRPARFVLWEFREEGPTQKGIPGENVAFFAFAPDGRQLAIAQPDGLIALHDLVNGGCRRLAAGCPAGVMAFRPDGRQLALVNFMAPEQVRVLDLETNLAIHLVSPPDAVRAVAELAHPDDVRALAWSANGRLLAAGCDDRNIHVWDTVEWRTQAVLEGHQGPVIWLAFSPAGELLASTSSDGTTRLWDPVSGRPLVSAPGRCCAFSPDGRRLAFVRGPHLGVWEVADGRECRVLHHGRLGNRSPGPFYKGPERLDFSPDGRLLASVGGDGVRLWDVAGRREAAFLNAGYHEAALFHPDGTRLYTFGETGLRCWPIRADDRGPGGLRVGPPQLLDTPTVRGWGWFRGGLDAAGRLVTACDHRDEHHDRLSVFPAARPAERTVLRDHSRVSALAISPNGRWVAAGMMELGVKVWETRTGALRQSLPGEQQFVAFSPDNLWLLGGGLEDYRLWQVGSWEAGPVIPRDRREMLAGRAAFRPDGRVLAVTRDIDQVQLLDFATRQEIVTLAAPDLITWLCFSPDGRLLVMATESRALLVWDLAAVGDRLRALRLGCDLLPGAPAEPPGGTVPPRVRVIPGVCLYEAEDLKVLAAAGCHEVFVQDMAAFGREAWSNGKQMFCVAFQKGFVELQLDVPETGRYTLEVRFTRAPNYGRVQVALDGRNMGAVFEGYDERVIPAAPIRLGTVELSEGCHRLRFTAVDKDPRSLGYLMGIDWVKLTPADGPSMHEGRRANSSPPS